MQKTGFVLLVVLLVIASCTKKAAPAAVVPKPVAIDGAPLYAQNCALCHGATGAGGHAPDLTRGEDSKNEIVDKVTNGAGRMPAFADKLSGAEIDAVALFVLRLKK